MRSMENSDSDYLNSAKASIAEDQHLKDPIQLDIYKDTSFTDSPIQDRKSPTRTTVIPACEESLVVKTGKKPSPSELFGCPVRG